MYIVKNYKIDLSYWELTETMVSLQLDYKKVCIGVIWRNFSTLITLVSSLCFNDFNVSLSGGRAGSGAFLANAPLQTI